MKIAVCDDSRSDRGTLRVLLKTCGQDFEIKEYGSGAELCGDMGYIRECGIVFLDINMDGQDGLATAKRIKEECPKVHIVLVTAYMNYVLEGYKVKASRFLLKDDLERTLKGMGFVRIHQSFLINMRYIEKISSYVMVLTTGKEISVPKSRYPEW